ncbi:hypothetical protein D3C71_1279580 [compost metagenome]
MDDLGQAMDAGQGLAGRGLHRRLEVQIKTPVRLDHLFQQGLEVDVGVEGVAFLGLG